MCVKCTFLEYHKRLVTNYGEVGGGGEATKREGVQVKFYIMKRRGGKSFSHAVGGGRTSSEIPLSAKV